jgi:hypothetical protein
MAQECCQASAKVDLNRHLQHLLDLRAMEWDLKHHLRRSVWADLYPDFLVAFDCFRLSAKADLNHQLQYLVGFLWVIEWDLNQH